MSLASVAILFLLTPCHAQVADAAAMDAASMPAPLGSSAQPLLLGPGDLVSIQVFNTPELSGNVRLDEQGNAGLPLGGVLRLGGLSPLQAAAAVETQLRTGRVMLDPHVTILVTQYATQGITVLGEVARPGTFTLLGPHSLYDALSAGGGVTANEGSSITVTHQADPAHPLVIDVHTPNYSATQRLTAIQPGDTVLVSRAELIYIVGDVVRPGPYPMISGVPLSILNILGLSQGLNRTAAVTKASIVRQVNGQVVTIPVDLDKIMRSQEPNINLQAADILVVPRSGKKVFLEYALPATTSAVTSAVTSALIVR